MQAIVTRYHGPTDTRGSRITARCSGGRVSVPYPHERGEGEDAARVAAEALVEKMGWTGYSLIGGQLPNGDYVFVLSWVLS